MRLSYFFVPLLLLGGCGLQTEFEQQVVGQLTVIGGTAEGLSVALVQEGGNSSCSQPAVSEKTDQNGRFRFQRTAKLGKFAVLVQHDTLCIQEGGAWQVAWRGAYGPAPEKMLISCSRAPSASWLCTMNSLPSTQ